LDFLARHVVVLEDDAARLQRSDFALDVVDLPERLARFRGARVRRQVQECGRSIGERVNDTAGDLLLRSKAELVFVEAACARDILCGEVGVQR
jgi:hypothetical protein